MGWTQRHGIAFDAERIACLLLVEMVNFDIGNVHSARYQIVHEGRGQQLAVLVEHNLLIEPAADPLRGFCKTAAKQPSSIQTRVIVIVTRLLE